MVSNAKTFFLLVLLVTATGYCGAQNLVPNPSFEDMLFCPSVTTQIDAANGWMSFGLTPDYYNSCAPMFINVPNSEFGFQYAHTGDAMAGLTTYRWPGSPDGSNCREFIGIQLASPLAIGEKYFISFFTNFAAGPSVCVAANKIGCRFSTIPFSTSNVAPINNYAVVYTDSILSDSVAWIKLSGSFIADSAYSYFMIGNFFQDSLTDTLHVGNAFADYTYYYIDDACVSTDSNLCANFIYNEVKQIEKGSNILVYPNPAVDFVNIDMPMLNEPYSISIYDNLGREVFFEEKVIDPIEHIPIGNICSGVLFVKIAYKKEASIYKLVKM